MKKIENTATLLPDYGKQKLLTYADSFRDLAKTFMYLPQEQENTLNGDRQDFLLQKRLLENRGLLAEHLNEMAGIMTKVAEESFRFMKPSERQIRQLSAVLKEQGIVVKDIYMIENRQKRLEITANMRLIRTSMFSVEEIAGVFSVVFNKRLLPKIGSISYLNGEMQTIIFEEESHFGILTGVARAIKEKERISGDAYSFIQTGNGNMVSAISDGMGTGEKACKDSSEVIELLEKLLEAEFGKETAVQIINGVLIAGSEKQNMSTLDICDIDLYTGICEFLKIGSAPSFLKRGSLVEKISSATLPMGVFAQMDMDVVRKRMMDGDYIIMVTDGVIDSLPIEENEEVFREMISRITIQNPKEIANYVLNYAIHAAQGNIKDDMTVLVIGIWENSR